MLIDRAMKNRLVVTGILLALFIIVGIVFYQQSRALGSIPSEYNSDLGEDGAEGSAAWLRLENNDAFKDAFPITLQVPILNGIYGKFYDTTGVIARHAELSGGVSSRDKAGIQKFKLLMGDNKTPIDVEVNVKNAATNDFVVVIKEIK